MRVLRKRLFNLLDWIVPLAPKMCIPQCKLPLAMPWKEEMMLSGKGSWKGSQHFSWNADHWFGCKPLFVLGSKAWASSVVFNQVQVGPSCWCLIFGVGRCKRFSSPLMHRFSLETCLEVMCVTGEPSGFRRLIHSWGLLRHCFFSPGDYLCCMFSVSVVYACTKRQYTPLVITDVSLQTWVAGTKNVHGDLKIVFKTSPSGCTAWGCIGPRLTKGHQFRRALVVLQSFVWSSVSSTIIWKSCPCEQDQLLWASSTSWKTMCKADMLLWLPALLVGVWDQPQTEQ